MLPLETGPDWLFIAGRIIPLTYLLARRYRDDAKVRMHYLPPVRLQLVDVRDAAELHVAVGLRYLAAGVTVTFQDIAILELGPFVTAPAFLQDA